MTRLHTTITTAIILVAFSTVTFGQAQDEAADVLTRRLRAGDDVWVRTGWREVHVGRVVDVGSAGLRLAAEGREELIPMQTVYSVERKRNGVLLGTLIGLGVGVACGLPLASLASNEGGSPSGAVLFMAFVGAGGGAGLDALMSVRRTVYTRRTASITLQPVISQRGAGVVVTKQF